MKYQFYIIVKHVDIIVFHFDLGYILKNISFIYNNDLFYVNILERYIYNINNLLLIYL